MKTRFIVLSLLLSSLLLSSLSISPAEASFTGGVSAATPTPDAISSTPPVDAWLMFDLVEESAIRRAVNMAGKPMIELGGGEGTIVLAVSPAADQPWYSEFTRNGDDGGIAVSKVENNIPTEIIPLLRTKSLSVLEKDVLFKEFSRKDQSFMAWSPDGTRLAYLNVPEGKKTRLLVYDTGSKTSAILSQANGYAIAPVWSPDGEWLLYQTVDGFNPQGLPKVTSMHAVRANGSEDHLLYEPSSLRETVLGWSQRDIFVVQSMIERGNRDLRLVSLKDGSSLSLNTGLIKNAAWDTSTQTAMYLLTASETNNEQPSGVYAVTASSPQRMVLPGKWEALQFFPHSGAWVASAPGTAGLILHDGSTISLPGVDAVLDISPDGKTIAVNKTGGGAALVSSDGRQLSNLADKPFAHALFSPDGATLYYEIDFAMFTAALPDWKPVPFTDGNMIIGWVGY